VDAKLARAIRTKPQKRIMVIFVQCETVYCFVDKCEEMGSKKEGRGEEVKK
jgi:hypothetical protein